MFAPSCPGTVEVVVVMEVVVVVCVEGIGHAVGDGHAVPDRHAVRVGQPVGPPSIVVVIEVVFGRQPEVGGTLEPDERHPVGGTVIPVVTGVQDDPGN